MSDIDRQRVTAVRTLRMMGYLFRDGDWVRGPVASPSTAETDRLHALLVMRADEPLPARHLALRPPHRFIGFERIDDGFELCLVR